MKKVTLSVVALLAVATLATSCKKDEETTVTPTPTPTPATKTLYERLGKDGAITAVVDQFISNVLADPTIADEFVEAGTAGKQYDLFRERLIDQICAATGGPYTYRGADMKTAHKGMNITDAEFGALVTALVKALDQFNVPATEKNELLAILGPMQSDIVGQ